MGAAVTANITHVLRDKHGFSGREPGTSQDAIHQDDGLGNKGSRDKRVGGASRPFFCAPGTAMCLGRRYPVFMSPSL